MYITLKAGVTANHRNLIERFFVVFLAKFLVRLRGFPTELAENRQPCSRILPSKMRVGLCLISCDRIDNIKV